jgi:hypothetical protein
MRVKHSAVRYGTAGVIRGASQPVEQRMLLGKVREVSYFPEQFGIIPVLRCGCQPLAGHGILLGLNCT